MSLGPPKESRILLPTGLGEDGVGCQAAGFLIDGKEHLSIAEKVPVETRGAALLRADDQEVWESQVACLSKAA